MDHAIAFLCASAINLRSIKFFCVIPGSTLIAGTQFFGFDPATPYHLPVLAAFWTGLTLSIVGGCVLLVVDRNTPQVLLALDKARTKARDAQERIRTHEQNAEAQEQSGIVLMAAHEAESSYPSHQRPSQWKRLKHNPRRPKCT